jgi:hypothetical protein
MPGKKKPTKKPPPTPKPKPDEHSRFLALRYPDLDLAIEPLDDLVSQARSKGFFPIGRRRTEEHPYSVRVLEWLSSNQGVVRLVVHDDELTPAMVLEITGPVEPSAAIEEIVEQCMEIAPAAEVLATARLEYHDVPAMLSLAAWVATDAEEADLLALLSEASLDADVEVRRGAAKAILVQASPACRALAETMVTAERDPTLAKQIGQMLSMWGADDASGPQRFL